MDVDNIKPIAITLVIGFLALALGAAILDGVRTGITETTTTTGENFTAVLNSPVGLAYDGITSVNAVYNATSGAALDSSNYTFGLDTGITLLEPSFNGETLGANYTHYDNTTAYNAAVYGLSGLLEVGGFAVIFAIPHIRILS